jgi:nitroimidazol reductase NimA-like FMN-containing flavoprotein (pyridoxamine 5'-phosphate oxidase superfamily)
MSGTSVEHLSEAECWGLLAAEPVGRLGVIFDSGPEIYPINHVLDGQSIVFRTDPGSKLAGLTKTPAVCYQVDGIDAEGHTGWSVLVKGRANEYTPGEGGQAGDLSLDYWTVGAKEHWVRITPVEVTGRRIWRQSAHLMGTPEDGAIVRDHAAFVRPDDG